MLCGTSWVADGRRLAAPVSKRTRKRGAVTVDKHRILERKRLRRNWPRVGPPRVAPPATRGKSADRNGMIARFPHRTATMRWLIAAVTALLFLIGVRAHSPGVMGFCIIAALVGLVATALAFADARIQENARNESLNSYELERLRRELKGRGEDPPAGG
jgi:hypothetical protein